MEDLDSSPWMPQSSTPCDAEPSSDLVQTMQTHRGLSGTADLPPRIYHNLMGRRALVATMDAIVPRVTAPVEEPWDFSALFPHISAQNIRELRRPGTEVHSYGTQTEPQSIAHDGHPAIETGVKLRLRYSADEWEEWKPKIDKLYRGQRVALPKMMIEMAKRGFNASMPMYKRKFKKWGWHKNQSIKKYAKSHSKSCVSNLHNGALTTMTDLYFTSTVQKGISIPTSSSSSTVAVVTARRSSVGSPRIIWQNQLDENVGRILFHVKILYMGSFDQKRWKVMDPYTVEEHRHRRFISSADNGISSIKSFNPQIGMMGIRKAFRELESVVADCGLFSLPVIWYSVLLMTREGYLEIAEKFLLHTVQLSVHMFHYDRNHPFVQAIHGLCVIAKNDPAMLQQVIFRTYRSCVQHVLDNLTSSHIITLRLWSVFVINKHHISENEKREVLDGFQRLRCRFEEDEGADADKTLDLLALMLDFIFKVCSTGEETDLVASDILCRIKGRVQAGDKIEGVLYGIWQYTNYILGVSFYQRRDLHMAIMHLENSVRQGSDDDLDIPILAWLAVIYKQLGTQDELDRVQQHRVKLFQQIYAEDDETE